MTFKDKHENLMNEMMCLSEVRGELDPVSNAKVETKLKETTKAATSPLSPLLK